jgi:hypothetical protein
VNLSLRYLLGKASKIKKPSVRYRQIAKLRRIEGLLGIPYRLIGQIGVTERLAQKLLSHFMVSGRQPLVLLFAGPSGYRKTELARRLGHLLSLLSEVTDCTVFNHEMELLARVILCWCRNRFAAEQLLGCEYRPKLHRGSR